MEARAVLRYLRMSPRKVRRVVDVIRGKPVGEALRILKALPQHASRPVEKLLRSAIANAQQKDLGDVDSLRIRRAFVDPGPTLKRIQPRAMGRAYLIRKRTSHVTLVLGQD